MPRAGFEPDRGDEKLLSGRAVTPTSPRSYKSFHPALVNPVPLLPSRSHAGGQHWGDMEVPASCPATETTRRGILNEQHSAIVNEQLVTIS